MVYCVGLTGSIASGKTTAAEIFSKLGIDVFHADKISRDLTTQDPAIYNTIVNHFGDITLEDGQLDRRRLRDIIFSNPEEKKWLEQLLHPLIREKLKEYVASSTTPYCIIEIPLLIDKKAYPYINTILVIDSLEEEKINRVMARDKCSREQALAIILVQPDLARRLKEADHVIINDAGFSELKQSVEQLHHIFLSLAQK